VRVAGPSVCGPFTATVGVLARDESGPATAEVRWTPVPASPTGAVVTPLEAASGGFSGTVGPFRAPAQASLLVTVVDARGNLATDEVVLAVAPCP
jgi:hypothetical protein